jgi:hypothetical protein
VTDKSPLLDRFVVGVDVQKYGSRNVRRQSDTQRELDRLLRKSAAAADLNRELWDKAPGGDGELAVLPPDIDLAKVVGRFVSALNEKLCVYNEDRVQEMKIRLRVAMHIDTLMLSSLGYAGPALVVLSRLLDSRPVRDALIWATDAELALLVSEPVHRKVVESGLGGIQPKQFRAVQVELPAKDFSATAYLHVPGMDMSAFEPPADTEVRYPPRHSVPGPPDADPDHPGTADREPGAQPAAAEGAEPTAQAGHPIQIAGTIHNTGITSGRIDNIKIG